MRRVALHATLALTAGLAAASLTLITPSLPSLQADLGLGFAHLGIAQAAYLVCLALPQIAYGSFSDRLGRRGPLIAGLAVFVAGSVAAVFAFDLWTLTLARLLQAAGASAGMVIARAILRDLHPEAKMASVMGYMAMAMMVIPMVAPAIGGLVQDSFGWQGNFWLLAGLGVGLIGAVGLCVPPSQPATEPEPPAMARVRSLLRSRRFHFFTLQFALASAANQAFFLVTPFVMERQFALSPAQYGAWFSLPPMLYFAGNFVSGLLAGRAGIVRMVLIGTVGVAIVGAGHLALQASGVLVPASLFVAMASISFFHALITPSAVTGATSALSSGFGTASGLSGFTQAIVSATTVMLASAAGIVDAVSLMWLLAGMGWLSMLLALLLRPRAG